MRFDARRVPIGISVALFAVSLALPPFCDRPGPCRQGYGAAVLAFGWLGALAPVSAANYAWFANPALGMAWLMLGTKRRNAAFVLSSIAVVLALIPFVTRVVATDESGTPRPIGAFGLGYAMWLAAIVTALAAAWRMRADRRG